MRRYVINLDRSPKRLKQFKEAFESLSLPFERVRAIDARLLTEDFGGNNAVDGAQITQVIDTTTIDSKKEEACFQQLGIVYNDEKARKYLGRSLNPGEVACFLSHIKALRQFLKTSSYLALIVEDDVIVTSSTKDALEQLESVLLTLPQSPYDVIHLGAKKTKYVVDVLTTAGQHDIFGTSYFPMGAYGLLWSKQGARAFLNQTTEIFAPFDVYLRHWLSHGGKGGVVSPHILDVNVGASTIDDTHQEIPTKNRVEDERANSPETKSTNPKPDSESQNEVNQSIRKGNKTVFYFFYRLRRVFWEKKWAVQKLILNRFYNL